MRTRRSLQIFVIVAAALFSYLTALRNGVVRDDLPVIAAGAHAQGSVHYWLQPLLHGGWGQSPMADVYNPLPLLTLAAEAALHPGHPHFYHLINVVLHAAVCVAVFLLAKYLLNELAAMVTALWFAVAPIHVQAVTSLGGRAQLLATLLLLAATLLAVRSVAEQKRGGWLGAVVVALLALGAMLSDFAVIAPLALMTVSLWLDRPHSPAEEENSSELTARRFQLSPSAKMTCAVGSATCAYVVLRVLTVGLISPLPSFLANPLAYCDDATRVRTALVITARQAGASLSALRLSPDYSYAQIRFITTWGSAPVWMAAGFLLALIALALIGRRQIALVAGLAFAAAAYLPHSNLFFAAAVARDNRLAYLPTVGAALVVGWLFENLWLAMAPQRKGLNPLLVSRAQVMFLVMIALVGLTIAVHDLREARFWRNDHRLASLMGSRARNSAKTHYYMGLEAAASGSASEAERQYQAALVIYPDYADAWYSLGNALTTDGQIPQALSCFRHAFDLEPTEERFLGFCDAALRSCDYMREAPSVVADRISTGLTDDVKTEIEIDLALAYLRLGHNIAASNILNDVLEVHPNNALARLYYSKALRGRGLKGQADEEFRLARLLNGSAVERALEQEPKEVF
jgi:Tfp pilus assembly protein PilF